MIEYIRLINCQSWADTTVYLSPDKLNIVRAPNNTGKSVLMKMLKISTSPKFFKAKKRKKLIRWGAEQAMALYSFTDGAQAAVVVRPTTVIYMFRENENEPWSQSLDPTARFLDELGMLVSSDGSFIANIIDTDQNLLLVDSDSKSTFDFMQMLCNNASLDEILLRAKEEQKSMNDKVYKIEDTLEQLNIQLQSVQYTDVELAERQLDTLTSAKNVMYSLIGVAYNLQRIYEALDEKDYNLLFLCVTTLQTIESLNLRKLSIRGYDESKESALATLEKLESIEVRKLLKPKEPTGIELVNVLSALEQIDVNTALELGKPIGCEYCDVLEKLESIKLNNLLIRRAPKSIATVDVLEKLESLKDCVRSYKQASNNAEMYATEILRYENELKKSGVVHDCEIYGRIIYDGKECIPLDY